MVPDIRGRHVEIDHLPRHHGPNGRELPGSYVHASVSREQGCWRLRRCLRALVRKVLLATHYDVGRLNRDAYVDLIVEHVA
jgi:hypothetical protein